MTSQEDLLPRYFIALASDEKIKAYEGVSYLTDVSARKGFAQWVLPETDSWSLRKFLNRFRNKFKA